ncbi:hypothetical protein BKA57DRAFT_499822 [Linnemannia elongata]|nr:hypothetical protein BKA57DRAFT_499822 [Linnemannia elongata]
MAAAKNNKPKPKFSCGIVVVRVLASTSLSTPALPFPSNQTERHELNHPMLTPTPLDHISILEAFESEANDDPSHLSIEVPPHYSGP